MDENQVFDRLGELRADVRGIKEAFDRLNERIERHFDDDSERFRELQIGQAQYLGMEASAARRSAGMATFLGVLAGAASGFLTRFFPH